MINKDMLFDENMLIELFIKADDTCQLIQDEIFSKMLEDQSHDTPYLKPRCAMTVSEVMTLLIFYHYSGFKCFEYFYRQLVMNELRSYFPTLLSYNRFVEVNLICCSSYVYFCKIALRRKHPHRNQFYRF